MTSRLPWHSRFDLLGVTFFLFLAGALGSIPGIEGAGRELDHWGNLSRFASQFFPPDWSILDRTLDGLVETLRIAMVSTFWAIFISIFLSLGAARNVSPPWILWPTRMVLNIIRTIPSSLVGIARRGDRGSNSLAGVIALTFYSVGYLAKFFSEAFESADLQAQQALRSLGASPFKHSVMALAKCPSGHLEPLPVDA